MSLRDFIDAVENQRKTLTVLNPDDPAIVDELADFFDDQNVLVAAEQTPAGTPADVAVLTQDDEYLAGATVDDLRTLLYDTPQGEDGLGFDDSSYEQFLRYLKETTFTSYGTSEMLAVTREIEDHAWRAGHGQLFAGFQYASKLSNERLTYGDLATKSLDLHVFASPDEPVPSIEGVTVHAEAVPEIETTWFVVYDGAGRDLDKCALLAAERADGEFYGFWTYNPDLVDRIVEYLRRTYDRVSA